MSRESFQRELDRLSGEVLELGWKVQAALEAVLKGLQFPETQPDEQCFRLHGSLRSRQAELEQECVSLQARQAPVAGDLRLIHAIRSIVDHLARAGILCEESLRAISEAAGGERDGGVEVALLRMAQAAQDIVSKALRAFEHRDVERTRSLRSADDEIDLLYSEVISVLADPSTETSAKANTGAELGSPEWRLQAALMAHYLERIADHGVGIARRTRFIVTGE